MKNKPVKTLLAIMILVAILITMTPAIFADATVRIETSASTIAVGKTLTITVKVSSGVPDLSSVGFDLKFDPNTFTFVSGSINGTAESDMKASFTMQGSNTVQVIAASYMIAASSNPLIATLKLTAKAVSESASFSLSNIELGDYNNVSTVPATFAGAKTVSVFQPSANADLKSLSIAPGILSPAFTSANTVYTVQIPETTSALSVDAVPADDKSKVSVSGHTGLKTGENNIKVVVTAESGATKTYMIKAYKAVPTPSPAATPTPAATVQIGGSPYSVSQLDVGQPPPAGFEATTTMMQGQSVPAYLNAKNSLMLLFLKDGAGKGEFYLYDANAGTYTLYQMLTIPAKNYVILMPDTSLIVPTGFSPATLMIDGHSVSGFQESSPGTDGVKQTLVYLMDAAGTRRLYAYEALTGTVLQFSGQSPVPTSIVTPEPTPFATPIPTSAPAPAAPAAGSLSTYLLIILALAFLVAVLIGILIYLLVSRKAYVKSQKPPIIRRVN